MNLAIIGPSGSGKGTQAKLIASRYGLKHISTGTLLREEMKKNSPLASKIASYVDRGRWVPSAIIMTILKAKLTQNFILDGTPRYLVQCFLLDRLLGSKGQKFNAVISLTITKEELRRRRRLYGDQFQTNRSDSGKKIFWARWESGRKTLGAIVNYYRARGLLLEVDGNRPPKAIFADISHHLDKINT